VPHQQFLAQISLSFLPSTQLTLTQRSPPASENDAARLLQASSVSGLPKRNISRWSVPGVHWSKQAGQGHVDLLAGHGAERSAGVGLQHGAAFGVVAASPFG
jgi:hypothetical protein